MNTSLTKRSSIRITAAALIAVAATMVGNVARATSADAATVHSVKVCGVNASSGRAETGATIYSYYWNGNKAVAYDSAKVGPHGCAWVTAPKGRATYYLVYRNPAMGMPYSVANQCEALGTFAVDYGTTAWIRIPTTTDGFNAGTVRAAFTQVRC